MVRVQNEQQPDRYRTGIQFRRFANAMRRIPEGAIVGYISNVNARELRGMAAFAGTQYAIAPRLLLEHTSPHVKGVVIGNFSAEVQPEQMIQILTEQPYLKLEENLGDGVVLFRKESGE